MTLLHSGPSKNDHKKGDLNAPVILVEYGDYECPHSTKASQWIPQLLHDFGNNICYIFRHFPLAHIHPQSALAAIAAEAAGLEGKFWEMHEALYRNHFMLSTDVIMSLAEELNLNEDQFLQALDREDLVNHVCEDIISGEESGVFSTPAFFINGMKMEGPISLEILRNNIINSLSGRSMQA